MRQSDARFWTALAAVLLAAGLYSSVYALRGWIPHDEGLLGQMAERVLAGELPHADFDETYSGGLTLLNALSFALFGHRISSMRVTLFLFQLGFLASVFAIAARAVPLAIAALLTFLCLAWGVPNYFGGLPSWYNLGFAIFGIHAAVKYVETDRIGWVALAGFLGGLSCLFKVAGIYFLIGFVVFLIYRSQVLTEGGGERRPNPLARALPVLVVLLCPIIFLLRITWARLDAMGAIHFVLPGALLCGLVARNEVQRFDDGWRRLRRTTRSVVCLAIGAAAPVAVFLVPYIFRNDLYSVYRGLFILPQLRYDFAFYPLPPLVTLLATIPPAVAICIPLFTRRSAGRVLLGVVFVSLAVLLPVGSASPVYLAVWYSVRPLGPIAVGLLCYILFLRRADPAVGPERRQFLFLMAVMAGFLGVIQFPYAFGVYFYYAAPPIALALVFAASVEATSWSKIQICFVLFYIGFGVLWLNTANVRFTGFSYVPSEAEDVLLAERANVRVSGVEKAVYQTLVGVIDEVAGDDSYIMATPDCPEVYFLSRRKNPTRVFYEFFDPAKPTAEQLLATLATKGVRVVVLNSRPEFSERVSQELYELLAETYPEHVDIGWFRVLWKTRRPSSGLGDTGERQHRQAVPSPLKKP